MREIPVYPRRIENTDQALGVVNYMLGEIHPWPEQVRAFTPGTFTIQHTAAEATRRGLKMAGIGNALREHLAGTRLQHQVHHSLQVVSDEGLVIYPWGTEMQAVCDEDMEELARRFRQPLPLGEEVPGTTPGTGDTVRCTNLRHPGYGHVEILTSGHDGKLLATVDFGGGRYADVLAGELILVRPFVRVRTNDDH